MFKKGDLVKVDRITCETFNIVIPYGIIKNITNFECNIRFSEVCIFDDMEVFNHFSLGISKEHIGEV